MLDLRNKVDHRTVAILRDVHEAARHVRADLLLIGASARDLWLQTIYKTPVARATEDYDLAVLVNTWAHYDDLVNTLVATGSYHKDSHHSQRLINGNLKIDLVPFGDLETAPDVISWPPEGDIQMSTLDSRSDRTRCPYASGG